MKEPLLRVSSKKWTKQTAPKQGHYKNKRRKRGGCRLRRKKRKNS